MNKPRQFRISNEQSYPISPHLFCTICRDVFYKPLRVSCGHTFCGSCILNWLQYKRTCPECRYHINRNFLSEKDLFAESMISEVQIECLRCENWRGHLKNFKNHITNQCQFVTKFIDIQEDVIEIEDDNQFKSHSINIELESLQQCSQKNFQQDSEIEEQIILTNQVSDIIYQISYQI
ncbi:unnamed protein product [Paramecium sonneborni]|uniref:RING-type domain-containing protein n=1 Tax=Paramecium sonneborni TaxID=65129 RepID=A0A8S1P0D3_9CILI|nr:unnamed protein product [Paramecium sonneborni]CAD8095785.1 unnamed protein product [Paramecium sonneborni]